MKQFATLLLASSLLLTACSEQIDNITKEGTEAFENLAEEAIDVKEGIETKVNQIKQAGEDIKDAAESIQEATDFSNDEEEE